MKLYLNELLGLIWPYLRGNGGPIIMIQVEIEMSLLPMPRENNSLLTPLQVNVSI